MFKSRNLVAWGLFPALFVSASVFPLWGQKGGGSTSSGSAGNTSGSTPGNVGSTGRNPGNIPGNTYPGSANSPSTIQRPIFLSGKVMFDDGSPTNSDIRIERVCNGIPRLESHTDSKGRFSFQVGQNQAFDVDASSSSGGGMFGRPDPIGGFGNPATGVRPQDLWNCELRASYPGYRSDVVELATRRSMDDPNVGTIVLHHLGNVQGTTVSLTSALAPKDAQKNYNKGLQLAQKGKFEEAEQRLREATQLYPKYAQAWYALGQVQQHQGQADAARKAYETSIGADSKFVSPYDQLAKLSAEEGKWEDAASYSKQAISLNPVEFPSSLWYNAIANYNLKRPTDAEKSVKDLLKLDTQHRYPDAENMMAQILLDKGQYPEAATHLRSYLKLVPNAKNADNLRQILLKLDQASAATPAVPAGQARPQ